jgi:hypothetical protein
MTARRCTTRLALGLALGALMAAPAAAQTALSGEALAIACGPRASYDAPAMAVTVGGSLTGAKGVYAPWHRLVINAGSDDGMRSGQEFFVRRIVRPRELLREGEKPLHAVSTAGWIRIDETQSHRSIASILHECDGISPGDFLEPFAVPSVPTPLPEGNPDYVEPGHVVFGAERQQVAGSGSMMLVDRGSKQGIQPGQHFTIYRPSDAGPNVIVARALVVSVQPDVSMVRIHDMRDAVMAGDLAAPHR